VSECRSVSTAYFRRGSSGSPSLYQPLSMSKRRGKKKRGKEKRRQCSLNYYLLIFWGELTIKKKKEGRGPSADDPLSGVCFSLRLAFWGKKREKRPALLSHNLRDYLYSSSLPDAGPGEGGGRKKKRFQFFGIIYPQLHHLDVHREEGGEKEKGGKGKVPKPPSRQYVL